jgi:RNA polymerase sigma-70 factor (ECF subfamily)
MRICDGAAPDGQLPGASDDTSGSATQWELIRDPAHVIKRYAPAIRHYFGLLIRNPDDAEEATQEFFLRIVESGFSRVRQERGRFRDYLRKSVRNAALNFLRDQRRRKHGESRLPPPHFDENPLPREEREWVAGWRRCLIKRVFRALASHEQQSPGNYCYTVLCAVASHPADSCLSLAERVERRTGRRLSAAAFRQQVSRARRLLAKLLVKEVQNTLDHPTPEQVAEELIALGLWERVRPYLRAEPS